MENRINKVREILNRLTDDNGGDPSHSGMGRFWNLSREIFVNGPVAGKRPIEVGRPEDSFLVKILKADVDGMRRMPRGGPYISDDDLAVIEDWIRDGAPDATLNQFAPEWQSIRELTKALKGIAAMKSTLTESQKTTATETLVASVREAIRIEFATIPPYLTAMWSIIPPDPDNAKGMILGVVIEEMLHMGLMSNLFAAIAPKTEILDFSKLAPSYPSQLPGGVRPNLIVKLTKFDPAQVAVFVDIESFSDTSPGVDTIGEFYKALEEAIDASSLVYALDRQLERRLRGKEWLFKINNANDAKRAIAKIRHQGEGNPTGGDPWEDPSDPSLGFAHYFQFAEFVNLRRLTQSSGSWKFDGAPMQMPQLLNMANVPSGGYPIENVEPAALNHLREFNLHYLGMVNKLTETWSGNAQAYGEARVHMDALELPAVALMKTLIQSGPETYAPDFILR